MVFMLFVVMLMVVEYILFLFVFDGDVVVEVDFFSLIFFFLNFLE